MNKIPYNYLKNIIDHNKEYKEFMEYCSNIICSSMGFDESMLGYEVPLKNSTSNCEIRDKGRGLLPLLKSLFKTKKEKI